MSKVFCENDIRPDELVKKQKEFCEQDIAFLLSKKDEFVEVECPACGSTDYHDEFKKILLTIGNVKSAECYIFHRGLRSKS